MHRKMLDDARRRAEEEAHQERQRVLMEARRQAEEEARRHREELQQRLHAEAEMMARQQAEELARRQSELAEAQRRQEEEMTRRQQEELSRRQQAQMEQQRVLSMMPPAGTAAAGSALLSLIQGNNEAGGASGMPGWGNQQQAPTATPQSEADATLWNALGGNGGGAVGQLGANGDLAGWGRGRGRGRGVCSAALGTARRGEGGDANSLLSALGAMGLEGGSGADGLHMGDLSSFPQYGAADSAGLSGEAGDADAGMEDGGKKGRKTKRDKKRAEEAVQPLSATMTEAEARDADDRALQAALEASRNQPQPGMPPHLAAAAPTFAGWGGERKASMTLAQIQAQEEVERKQREAEAAAIAAQRQAAAAAGGASTGSAWASGTLPNILSQQAAPKVTSFAELMAQQQPPAAAQQPTRPAAPTQRAATPAAPAKSAARADEDEALLWDYGAAPAPPPQVPAQAGAATPTKAAAQAPAKGKKKGKAGAEAAVEPPSNGAQSETSAFGLDGSGDGQMPVSMSQWCATQMAALTGNDDTTLTDFLFSLQSDDEVHSYLTMYLGQSHAVDSFAKEFTLRKRAARGTGESREWQTAGRRAGKEGASPSKGVDDDGFATKPAKSKRGKKVADPSLLGFSVESSRIMQGEIDFPE
jgi:hypothetical protein